MGQFELISEDAIKRLDVSALGVYCKLFAFKGETFNPKAFAEQFGISNTKVNKLLKVLAKEGFLERYPQKNEHGRYNGYLYKVYSEHKE